MKTKFSLLIFSHWAFAVVIVLATTGYQVKAQCLASNIISTMDTLSYCKDGIPDNAVFNNDLGNLTNYAFVITNSADLILVTELGNSYNFESLTAGEYHVYGVSYFGVLNAPSFGHISTTTGSVCATLSSNFLVVYLDGLPSDANAGTNQQLCAASQTTLVAQSPTTGAGTWSQISGPSTAMIGNQNSAITPVTNLVGGIYEFQWITQNGACSGIFASRDTVIIDNVNMITADAGVDQVLCNETTAVLMGNSPGTGSGLWTQISGNFTTINNPSTPNTTVSGLISGTYNFVWRITDGTCFTMDTVKISVGFTGTIADAGNDLIICEEATLNLSGNIPVLGSGMWTLVSGPSGTIISPTVPTSSVTGLQVGNYVFAWTITNGICTTSDTVEWTLNNTPSLTTLNVQDVSGPGAMDGFIEVCATGGTPPYMVGSIPAGAVTGPAMGTCTNTYTVSNLVGGDYNIYLEDANGCVDTLFDIQVFEVDCSLFTITGASSTNITCFGDNNGTLSLSASGGTASYTYSIGNGIPDTTLTAPSFTFNNLPAGNYPNIMVTDDVGCSLVYPFLLTITEPPELIVSAVPTPETSIGLSNGLIDLCIDGGSSGYTISLTPNLGFQVNQGSVSCDLNYQFQNLPPADYQIIVEDAIGCADTLESIIVSSPSCIINIDSVEVNSNPSCFGENDGSITIYGSGSANYQFSVDGGQTFTNLSSSSNSTISNLTTGSYDIVIKDGNFCQAVFSANPIVLTEPDELVVNVFPTNTSTTENDGSITVCINGGITGYAVGYTSGVSGSGTLVGLGAGSCQGNFEATGLSSDTYSIFVTDANNCTYSVLNIEIQVADCTMYSINSVTTTDVVCKGDDTGTATVSVNNGGAPYMYIVDDGIMQDTIFMVNDTFQIITGLGVGNYIVTVLDNFQCSVNTTFQIVEPPTAIVSGIISINPSSIGASDGQICISPTGGIPPYTITASCGTVTPGGGSGCAGQLNISNLGSGSCMVTIEDSNGCVYDEIVNLIDPACDNFTLIGVEVNDISCTGSEDGNIVITVSGGIGPYQYSIDNGFQFASSNLTTFVFPSLSEGNYNVVVRDNLGCSNTYIDNPVTVSEPVPIALSFNTIPSCLNDATGRADLTVVGGTSPFSYEWSTGATTEDISSLSPSSYQVTVTDVNLCEQTGNVILTELTPVAVDVGEDLEFFAGEFETVNVQTNALPPFDIVWSPATGVDDPTGEQVVLSPSTSTTYEIEVTSREGCVGKDTLVVVVTSRGVFAIPSGFTPNGDSNNDTFSPIIQGGASLKIFRIFNRWGELIHDNTNSWDGKYNGEDQPVGTYVYFVEYQDDQGVTQVANGHVSLLR